MDRWLVRSPNAKAVFGIACLAIMMGTFLFIPTATIRYWQAWSYLVVFFGAALLITLYLMKNDRAPLERRLHGGPTAEKVKSQKIIMWLPSNTMTLTQGLLASMFGVRRDDVAEAAAKLHTRGLIEYRADSIVVPDRVMLERGGCDCYTLVKAEFDRLLPRRAEIGQQTVTH